MKKDRVLLNLKRWKQRPAECAIAAATTIAHFYDKDVTYEEVRELVPRSIRKNGLWTSQEARLLNELGFGKVTIVTADLDLVDFSWSDFEQDDIVDKLKKLRAHYGRARDKDSKKYVHDMIQWLEDEDCDNQLRIDQDFPKYIKRSLKSGRPVGASVNWTALHKFSKSAKGKPNGDISGYTEYHAIVLRGYDEKGVFVVDSHTQFYKGRLKNIQNGYYKISWEKFLVTAPTGDLILIG